MMETVQRGLGAEGVGVLLAVGEFVGDSVGVTEADEPRVRTGVELGVGDALAQLNVRITWLPVSIIIHVPPILTISRGKLKLAASMGPLFAPAIPVPETVTTVRVEIERRRTRWFP